MQPNQCFRCPTMRRSRSYPGQRQDMLIWMKNPSTSWNRRSEFLLNCCRILLEWLCWEENISSKCIKKNLRGFEGFWTLFHSRGLRKVIGELCQIWDGTLDNMTRVYIGMSSSTRLPVSWLPSRELTYPTWGIGKSSSKVPLKWDMLVSWRVIIIYVSSPFLGRPCRIEKSAHTISCLALSRTRLGFWQVTCECTGWRRARHILPRKKSTPYIGRDTVNRKKYPNILKPCTGWSVVYPIIYRL